MSNLRFFRYCEAFPAIGEINRLVAPDDPSYHGLEVPITSSAARPTDRPTCGTNLIARAHIGPIDPATARAELTDLLERAKAIDARGMNLALPSLRGLGDSSDGFDRYQDAVNLLYDLLRSARGEAEASGIPIGIEVCRGGLFLSPIEFRELLDGCGSWVYGACLDVDRIRRVGSPSDWMRTLTHRVRSFRLSGSDAEFDSLCAVAQKIRLERIVIVRTAP